MFKLNKVALYLLSLHVNLICRLTKDPPNRKWLLLGKVYMKKLERLFLSNKTIWI